ADAIDRFGGLTARDEGSPMRARTVRVSSDKVARREQRRRLGLAIRARLVVNARSANSVAREIGVSPASVSNWCRGVSAPSAQTFSQLCVALALPEEDLSPDGQAVRQSSAGNELMRWLDSLGLKGATAREK